MGVGADIEAQHALARQRAAHRIDGGMGGERPRSRTQRRLEQAAMLGERLRLPGRARLRQRDEMRQHPVEIADDLVGEPHRGRDVDRLDVDLQ